PRPDGAVRPPWVPARRHAVDRDRARARGGDLAGRRTPGRRAGPALRLARAAPLLALLHSSTRFRARLRPASRRRSTNRIHRRTGMRALALIVISMCTALAPAAPGAQDEGERQKQTEDPKKQPDAAPAGPGRRGAHPPPPAPGGAPTPTTAPASQAQPPAAATPSAMDVARPRQPFGLYQQR